MRARVGALRRLSAAAVLAVFIVLLPPRKASGQTPRVAAWVGLTSDVKPGLGSSSTSHSGPSFGVGVVQGSYSAHVVYTDFSDADDRWTIDLLLGYRWPLARAVYVDAQLGPSFLRRTIETGSGEREQSSTDWLLGPVLGISSSAGGSAELELAVPVQFRWSPDFNDFLRLGIRVGVRFAV